VQGGVGGENDQGKGEGEEGKGGKGKNRRFRARHNRGREEKDASGNVYLERGEDWKAWHTTLRHYRDCTLLRNTGGQVGVGLSGKKGKTRGSSFDYLTVVGGGKMRGGREVKKKNSITVKGNPPQEKRRKVFIKLKKAGRKEESLTRMCGGAIHWHSTENNRKGGE